MQTNVTIDVVKDTAADVDAHFSKGFFDAIKTAVLAAKDASVSKVFIVADENTARIY